MPLAVRDNGAWRTPNSVFARVAGSWLRVNQVYVRVNGVWVSTFADEFSMVIANSTSDVNLRSLALASGWNGVSRVNLTINSGVVISASSTGGYAMTVDGTFPNGASITNNGAIVGRGGNGGAGGAGRGDINTGAGGTAYGGATGGGGGPALLVQVPVTINNNGTIAGGGGGGGGGGSTIANQFVTTSGGGGGGGK